MKPTSPPRAILFPLCFSPLKQIVKKSRTISIVSKRINRRNKKAAKIGYYPQRCDHIHSKYLNFLTEVQYLKKMVKIERYISTHRYFLNSRHFEPVI